MSKMNYTKGEWIKKGNKITAFGRGIIAICPSPTNANGVLEFVANAQLISASPDLYEALREIRQFVTGNQFIESAEQRIIIDKCSTALVKVEDK